MMISPGVFFIFSKFWFSGLLGGGSVKGQKMFQNEKKFCLLCSISQESYIIWFSFMVFMFKMIIPPGVFFFFFSQFWFSGLLLGKKGKKRRKMMTNSICRAWYLRSHISYDHYLWYIRIIPPGVFLFFQNFDFLGCEVCQRVKMAQNNKKTLSFALYISKTIHHVILIYGTHV